MNFENEKENLEDSKFEGADTKKKKNSHKNENDDLDDDPHNRIAFNIIQSCIHLETSRHSSPVLTTNQSN